MARSARDPSLSRRRFVATTGAALGSLGGLAALAAGCATSAAPAKSSEPVSLSLLWVARPGEEKLWSDEYPRLLAKRHPNVRVSMDLVPYGNEWATLLTKVVSLAAAGTPPDASRNAGFNARQLLNIGALKDVSAYARAAKYPFGQHFAAAFPAHLKADDGKLLGLPVSILSVVRYVNKSLLGQIGLSAPSDWSKGNWTLAQMLENSRRLTRGSGVDKTFGMNLHMNSMHSSHWFWTNGAEVIDAKGVVRINEAAALDTLQHGLAYYSQHISPTAEDLRGTSVNNLFTSGRLAMSDFSQSSIPIFAAANPVFEWGVMPTSIGKTGKAWSVQFVDFWYVHAQSKQAERAYEAIEVLNSEDFEVAMARNLTGGIPTLKSVAAKFTKELFKVDPEVSLASLERSREPYYAVNHNDVQAVVNRHINGVWTGQESVQQAAESTVRESQAILAADKGA